MNHPVVILHGWGLSQEKFHALQEQLAKRNITAYAPDLPGFGKSSVPDKPLFLADYADFLDSYLKKHHIAEPILLGHSFGGRVALKYQFMYPHNVAALILTGTPGYTPIPRVKRMVLITVAKIGKAFFNFPFLRNWYYYVAGAREYNRAQGAMKETFKNIVNENLVAYMNAVCVSTLLVWGDMDRITPLWIAHKMNAIIKNSKLVVIPGDHGIAYKKPKEFVDAVYDFMRAIT